MIPTSTSLSGSLQASMTMPALVSTYNGRSYTITTSAFMDLAIEAVELIHACINEQDYQRKLVDWAISQDLTFRQVTHEETRNLLAYQRPQLLRILPSSHNTLVNYIKQAYKQRQVHLRDMLHS